MSIIVGWLRPPTTPEKGIPQKEIRRLIADPEKQTWSEGGRLCDKCRAAKIRHDDLFGYFEGGLFFVRGFKCPKCGYQFGETSYKAGVLRYDWRRLP